MLYQLDMNGNDMDEGLLEWSNQWPCGCVGHGNCVEGMKAVVLAGGNLHSVHLLTMRLTVAKSLEVSLSINRMASHIVVTKERKD